MFFLYENQGLDFDDVRASLVRMFGVGHSVTIHDGDGAMLGIGVDGYYCAGTIDSHAGPVASFSIDYVVDEHSDGSEHRHVLGIHIGPPGEWCRSESQSMVFEWWRSRMVRTYGKD